MHALISSGQAQPSFPSYHHQFSAFYWNLKFPLSGLNEIKVFITPDQPELSPIPPIYKTSTETKETGNLILCPAVLVLSDILSAFLVLS